MSQSQLALKESTRAPSQSDVVLVSDVYGMEQTYFDALCIWRDVDQDGAETICKVDLGIITILVFQVMLDACKLE
jgi:hypothetical protein